MEFFHFFFYELLEFSFFFYGLLEFSPFYFKSSRKVSLFLLWASRFSAFNELLDFPFFYELLDFPFFMSSLMFLFLWAPVFFLFMWAPFFLFHGHLLFSFHSWYVFLRYGLIYLQTLFSLFLHIQFSLPNISPLIEWKNNNNILIQHKLHTFFLPKNPWELNKNRKLCPL